MASYSLLFNLKVNISKAGLLFSHAYNLVLIKDSQCCPEL